MASFRRGGESPEGTVLGPWRRRAVMRAPGRDGSGGAGAGFCGRVRVASRRAAVEPLPGELETFGQPIGRIVTQQASGF